MNFSDFGLFFLGVPLEEREALKSLYSGTAAAISFATIHRPLEDFHHRIRSFPKHAVLVWENTPVKYPDIQYANESEVPLFRLMKDVAGQYTAQPVDLTVAMLTHPDAPRPAAPPAEDPDSDPVNHLLFSVQAPAPVPHPQIWRKPDRVTPDDITMVICIRAHSRNPWVMDRLSALKTMYAPAPQIQIVDFGSSVDFSEQIEQICAQSGFGYTFVDDKGVFALSKARNIGFAASTTDLVFFTDIDFAFPHDFFADLSRTASRLSARSNIDILLMCSAIHVSEAATSEYVHLATQEERSALLHQIGHETVYGTFGNAIQFAAPYSNIFLINRRLFSLVGGYDESFRGHGSEDFEFIARVNQYTFQFPVPPDLSKDAGGPLKKEFFNVKTYEGFRALNAATCLPGELQGLKAYHLYHPTPNDDSWRKNNDWKRSRLREAFANYENAPHNVLKVDALPRKKRVLCVCIHKDQWGYFAPLRLAGYEIIPLFDGSVKEIEDATAMITDGLVDAFAVFNPYMQSHMKFRALYYLAKKHVKVYVIERGALPSTIYYADDVGYTSAEYSDAAFDAFQPTAEQTEGAIAYMSQLREGNLMLERGHSYAFTARKYAALTAAKRPVCFIPLQLDEDMAVTMFVRDAQRYPDFYASINQVAADHPEQMFLIKPHPLSKGNDALKAPNIILADREDNIHCLLDIATYVVCYNSGVSLLAFAHEKTVYTIGNAYFNKGGAGIFADSLRDAVTVQQEGKGSASVEAARKVYAWLLYAMYSKFTAIDNIQEFATRKAHGYKDIVVTHLNLDGQTVSLQRTRANSTGIWNTYGFAHMNLAPPPALNAPAKAK
ncbi:glycosyltransferase [Roseomonas aerophila]|uniref:Glycosyltransferase n=1 Tax=Teichococcus aerophilus TaxID=1224513 RepID=A0ABR7RLW8_9PROT|nr:glycosyltransferase [Pseudoroseomonas aerophila]